MFQFITQSWVSKHFVVKNWRFRRIRRSYLLKSKAISIKNISTGRYILTQDSSFDRSFTILASIELVGFWRVPAWTSLQYVRIASRSCLIHLLLEDAPTVLNSVEVYAHSSQWCRSIDGSMRWCIVTHEHEFVSESSVLFFCTMEERSQSETPNTLQRSFSHLRRPQRCRLALSPWFRNQNTTPLPPCWHRMVAVHQPSTTPSIWTVQGCTALVSEQNCFEVSLHIFLGTLEPFLLVSIG